MKARRGLREQFNVKQFAIEVLVVSTIASITILLLMAVF